MIAEAEDEKSSAFVVSQEDIDSVLVSGSGFQNGKYRIYRQFGKHEDSKANITFLKQEYGVGGGTHDYPDGTRVVIPTMAKVSTLKSTAHTPIPNLSFLGARWKSGCVS